MSPFQKIIQLKNSKIFLMKKHLAITCIFLTATCALNAQDQSLLNGIDPTSSGKEYISNAFKSSRVINGHSMEFIGQGVIDFRILHRFGRVEGGVSEWFGLDQASMRMGLDYGLGKNLTVGIGRTTFKKDVDGFIKWRPVRQATRHSPFSWVLIAGISVFTYKNTDPQKELPFSSRAGYYYQSIVGRKFSNKFSLQISPTMVNSKDPDEGKEDNIFAVGIGSRFKLSKRTALVVDYFPVLNRPEDSEIKNSLSVGFDIETGGHVFQLHFSNATGMNERSFITDTHDSWGKREMRFGFNLSRVFSTRNKQSRY
jgi:hypothetical protein